MRRLWRCCEGLGFKKEEEEGRFVFRVMGSGALHELWWSAPFKRTGALLNVTWSAPESFNPTLTEFFFSGHSFLLSFYSLPQKFFFFLNKKHGLIGFGLG